jgi:hypothetical protein
MKIENIIYCIFALLLGMLLANMFQDICGCNVVEGNSNLLPHLTNTLPTTTLTGESPTSESPTSESPTSESPTSESPTSESPNSLPIVVQRMDPEILSEEDNTTEDGDDNCSVLGLSNALKSSGPCNYAPINTANNCYDLTGENAQSCLDFLNDLNTSCSDSPEFNNNVLSSLITGCAEAADQTDGPSPEDNSTEDGDDNCSVLGLSNALKSSGPCNYAPINTANNCYDLMGENAQSCLDFVNDLNTSCSDSPRFNNNVLSSLITGCAEAAQTDDPSPSMAPASSATPEPTSDAQPQGTYELSCPDGSNIMFSPLQ